MIVSHALVKHALHLQNGTRVVYVQDASLKLFVPYLLINDRIIIIRMDHLQIQAAFRELMGHTRNAKYDYNNQDRPLSNAGCIS
jgi:hypothetical protein